MINLKEYFFTKDIQNEVDNEKNFTELQHYAVIFSKVGNYKASITTQKLYMEKNNFNTPKPKPDIDFFKTFKPKNCTLKGNFNNFKHFKCFRYCYYSNFFNNFYCVYNFKYFNYFNF